LKKRKGNHDEQKDRIVEQKEKPGAGPVHNFKKKTQREKKQYRILNEQNHFFSGGFFCFPTLNHKQRQVKKANHKCPENHKHRSPGPMADLEELTQQT
jgi:hypothetical protein